MATKRLSRPRDPIALAKLIGDIATGQMVDAEVDGKDDRAASSGRRGDLLGGRSRALALVRMSRRSVLPASAPHWQRLCRMGEWKS